MSFKKLITGTAGFLVGILAYVHVPLSPYCFLFIALLGVIFLFSYIPTKRILYTYIGLFLVLFSLGAIRTSFVPSSLPHSFESFINTEISFTGKILTDPDLRERTQRITVQVEEGNEKTTLLVVTDLYPKTSLGETIEIKGMLERPEPFDTDGGRVFRYDQFLAKDGIFGVVQNAEIHILESRSGFMFEVRGFFSDIKNWFITSLSVALPEPESSLGAGLVAGGKQGLGSELLDAFIAAGLVHIVVLSGYNVMIVAEAVLKMCNFLPRRWSFVLAVTTIGGFVLASGAGSASIRAGLMAGVAVFARTTYRVYDAIRALLVVGLLMLIANPLLLPFDPGFQLSFIATLGLILGSPIIESKLKWIHNTLARELVSATLAAQISVLPLLLYQNGLFSLISLPANLLVLPIVPFAMLATFVAGVAGFIVPMLAPFIALPAYILLSYTVLVVEVGAALPLATVSIPAFPFWVTLLMYAVLVRWLFLFSHNVEGKGNHVVNRVVGKTVKE